MRPRLLPALGLLAGSLLLAPAACGPELESISQLSHVRIIGVRKSAPYARPGENIRLQMLWEDVSDGPPRDVQPFLAYWCVNPPGGLFAECLTQAPAIPPEFTVGQNYIDITVPESALVPSASSPSAPPSGSLYVFYGVCAGTLEIAGYPIDPEDGFGGFGGELPAGFGGSDSASEAVSEILAELAENGVVGEDFLPRCVDDDGQPLSSDDFVVGYSTVLLFDELRNAHPDMLGFQVAGAEVAVDCANESCAGPFDVPELDDCVPGVACFEACELDGAEGCPEVELRPVIPESVAERDEYAALAFGEDLGESIWVSYFTDRGRLTADLRLVNDPVVGWNASYSSAFRAPKQPGPVRIWAAVRDNRGGISYVRIPGFVRP